MNNNANEKKEEEEGARTLIFSVAHLDFGLDQLILQDKLWQKHVSLEQAESGRIMLHVSC